MSTFYHPYNFIPATGKINGEVTPAVPYDYHLDSKDQNGASTTARHDLYLNEHLSGRLICRIKTVTPTVVGNKHTKEREHDDASPTLIYLYRWRGKVAIPANSLRGMISNAVEIISQSALRVLDKEYWPSFAAINPNLVPWHDSRRATGGLTPAELIFGAVEDNKTKDGNDGSKNNSETQSFNLATRIRFYDALTLPDCEAKILEDRTTLKELGAPEPRAKDAQPGQKKEFNIDSGTINLYFDKDDKPLTHREVRIALDKQEALYPHGRKFYLLHKTDAINFKKKPSDNDDRKSKCELIDKEQTFFFHIDFDNLSHAELTLLIHALQPDADFHHRIGLGKSLGLGIVTVNICDLFIKDFKQRYAQPAATKYHQHKRFYEYRDWQLSSRYKLEKEALQTAGEFQAPEDDSFIDQDSLKLLRQTGKYQYLNLTPDISVRWRKGYEEYASRLPPLSVDLTELPVYPIGSKPKPQWLANLYQENTPAHQWLRNYIVQSLNAEAFEFVHEQEMNQIILGVNLAINWLSIEDPDQKRKAKNIIWSAANFIDSAWGKTNAEHKQAKRIYETRRNQEL